MNTSTPDRSQLKGVAVGAGYFSQFHLEAWQRMPDVRLAAICDADAAAGQRACDAYGIPNHYPNFEEMLVAEEPDFVDIITRPDSHFALSQLALDRGVHVICQKPLAPTFDEAQRLVETAEAASARFMVHENFRFQPWYREIKRLLDSGEIGDRLHTLAMRTRTGDGWQEDAYLARQPYFRTMDRFLIFETGVHFVDSFRYLAGPIDRVYASLRRLNPQIAGEDCGTVLFDFASGAQGLWDANRYNEPNVENPRFTFGEALIEGNGGTIRLYADGRLTIQALGRPESPHKYAVEQKNFAGDCVYATQRHFVDGLLGGQPFETGGAEYLETLKVQEAIYRSADLGQPVSCDASIEEMDTDASR